jgi:hypothetical protein
MKIIDLSKILMQREDDKNISWFKQGLTELSLLEPETADKIVTFIINYLLLEIKVNLKLVEVDDEVFNDKTLFEFSDKVKELFIQADWIERDN